MCNWACSASLRPPALRCQARGGRKQKATEREREEEAALRRRLLRRPLVLTTHAHERLQGRQVAPEEVEAVLRQGTLNRRMSKFGGKPSPVFVFEAELQAPLTAQPSAARETAAAGAATAAAVGQAAAAEAPDRQQLDAATQPQPPAEPATAAGTAAAAAGALPPGRRHLRIILAAGEDATVVLTAVDLEGGD